MTNICQKIFILSLALVLKNAKTSLLRVQIKLIMKPAAALFIIRDPFQDDQGAFEEALVSFIHKARYI